MPNDLDAIATAAAKKKAAQAALLDLSHGAPGTTSAKEIQLPSGMMDALGQGTLAQEQAPPSRMTYGLLKGLAGPAQRVTDAASMLPGAAGRAGSRGGEELRQMIEGIGKTMPPAGTGGGLAESAGEMIPSLLAPGGAITKGITAGLSQYQPAPEAGDRLTASAEGGLVGGLVGGAGDLLSKGVSKVLNSKEINRAFAALKDHVSETNMALAPVKGDINASIDLRKGVYRGLVQQNLEMGDSRGLIDMAVKGTDKELADLAATKVMNPDSKATKVLGNVVDKFGPVKGLPKKLTVGGKEFQLDPAGKYIDPSTGTELSPRVVGPALEAMGVKTTQGVKYSELRAGVEELDGFLKEAKPGRSTDLVTQARDVLKRRLEEATTPEMRRVQMNASRFYDKNLAEFDKPGIREVLTETDPLTRANKALDIALGGDKEATKTVAKLIPRPELVQRAAVHKALDQAFEKKTGQINAQKFFQFFEDHPTIGANFFEADTKERLGGMRNLLRHDALTHGESAAPSLAHPTGSFGLAIGLSEIVQGRVKEGLSLTAGSLVVNPAFKYLEKMMVNKWGRNLLLAANRARPDSPRMAHLVQAMTRRFGAVAGAETGQEMGQP